MTRALRVLATRALRLPRLESSKGDSVYTMAYTRALLLPRVESSKYYSPYMMAYTRALRFPRVKNMDQGSYIAQSGKKKG